MFACKVEAKRASLPYEILRCSFYNFNVDRKLAPAADELRRHAHPAQPKWVARARWHDYVVENSQKTYLAIRRIVHYLIANVNKLPARIHR
jgi:hypothetical protein